MKSLLVRFAKDESGATAIEYGLIAGLIAVMVIAGARLIGDQLARIFDAIGTALQGINP